MDSAVLFTADKLWMMICTALVFLHLGFSFLETGLTRQKILSIYSMIGKSLIAHH